MLVNFVLINETLDRANMEPVAEVLSLYGIKTVISSYDGRLGACEADAVVLGHDWSECARNVINEWKIAGKKTILLQHEGFFSIEEDWYNGSYPICDLALLWGEAHADIFKSRGYDGNHVITGPIHFDQHTKEKKITKDSVARSINISPDLGWNVFATQHFDREGNWKARNLIQRELGQEHAKRHYMPIFKLHPQEDNNMRKLLGFDRKEVLDINPNCEFIQHCPDLIRVADTWMAWSSTTLLERAILGLSYDQRCDYHPILDKHGGHNIAAILDNFCGGPLDGENANRAAMAIADLFGIK